MQRYPLDSTQIDTYDTYINFVSHEISRSYLKSEIKRNIITRSDILMEIDQTYAWEEERDKFIFEAITNTDVNLIPDPYTRTQVRISKNTKVRVIGKDLSGMLIVQKDEDVGWISESNVDFLVS